MASYLMSRMDALTETVWLSRTTLGTPKLLQYQQLVDGVGREMCGFFDADGPMPTKWVSLLVERFARNGHFVLSEYGMSQVDLKLMTVYPKRLLKAPCTGAVPFWGPGRMINTPTVLTYAIHLSNIPYRPAGGACVSNCKTSIHSLTAYSDRRDWQGRCSYESAACYNLSATSETPSQ